MLNVQKIKGLMAENDFTQESLGKELGVSVTYVKNILKLKSQPKSGVLEGMKKAFKLDSIDILFTETLPK